ncbi:MAG: pyruvate kinase [Anaerolineales bacterium]|nr:pyruvate kinase [Anaerolineales bacterium]
MRRTKIVCTLGPATNSEDKIAALIAAGMNVARLNFSHGTHAEHAANISAIRRLSRRLSKPVSILQDLQGPKIRTGMLQGGEAVFLKDQAPFTITTREIEGTADQVSTTYTGLPSNVQRGDRLLLDDGRLELQVERVEDTNVHTRVVHGGLLKEHKGINLPGVLVNIPSLTDKDREDLAFGVSQGVDYVAMSFVRRPADVAVVKRTVVEIDPNAAKLPVIAKLEKPAALENLEAILQVADGVMVARGDLGVELSPQEVPTAQKRIIEAANRQRKFVITATQMLESMIANPLPTRAEASDVANAIYDGSDAVMLSGETASGEYPIESVRMMAAIIKEAETHSEEWGRWHGATESTSDDSVALARAARELAHDRDVTAIAIFTLAGRNARIMSKARPHVPILVFTPDPRTYQRLPLLWGVTPYLIPRADTVEAMLAHVEGDMLYDSPVRAGQQVVVIAGLPPSKRVPANFILLHTVGRSCLHAL